MTRTPTALEIAKVLRWVQREVTSAEVALRITPGLVETRRSLEAANLVWDWVEYFRAELPDEDCTPRENEEHW